MVGSGSPLLAESSLRPTSPPASAMRSSRSKARSRDWTPPLEADDRASVVLALDGDTAAVLSGRGIERGDPKVSKGRRVAGGQRRSLPGGRSAAGWHKATPCPPEARFRTSENLRSSA